MGGWFFSMIVDCWGKRGISQSSKDGKKHTQNETRMEMSLRAFPIVSRAKDTDFFVTSRPRLIRTYFYSIPFYG